MADQQASSAVLKPIKDAEGREKLPRLPENAKIQKRPLYHPPIASSHAGPSQPKVIYISTTTPFMSAVTRVRKTLAAIEKRYMGHPTSAASSNKNNSGKRKAPDGGVSAFNLGGGSGGQDHTAGLYSAAAGQAQEGQATEWKENQKEAVFLKASNRAIEKALNLAMFFQQAKEGYHVTVQTGTLKVVDDIVEDDRPRRKRKKRKGKAARELKKKDVAPKDGDAAEGSKTDSTRAEPALEGDEIKNDDVIGSKNASDVEMTEVEGEEEEEEEEEEEAEGRAGQGGQPNQEPESDNPGFGTVETLNEASNDGAIDQDPGRKAEDQEKTAQPNNDEDEVKRKEGVEEDAKLSKEEDGKKGTKKGMDDIPETQIRKMSFVQVGISLAR